MDTMDATNPHDELSRYLASLDRDSCYRVDAVYKEGALETTQRVFFRGENGTELGPFVRKLIARDAGIGGAYETLFAAQGRGVRLRHLPRIVECYRTETTLVVVMEHVGGETLASCVERAGSTAARLALARRVFPDLCEAVSELHERLRPPVIHRDLKPGNVMVSEGGVALIDLGIAREYKEGAQQDTAHFGTRAYAPPEQFGFGQTSVRSDVYALGMLLFFCLTGREPAPRDREARFEGAGMPEALREVVVRATQLDPAARYASARKLRDEAGRALEAAEAKVPFAGDDLALPPHVAVLPTSLSPAPRAEGGEAPGAEAPGAEAPGAEAPAVGGPVAEPPKAPSFLSRVPRPLGVAWDVLVVASCALLVAACATAFASPSPQNASWPTWYLAVSYFVFLAPTFCIVSYLLLDRRPLRAHVSAIARLTVVRETRMGLRAVGVLFVVWVLATAVASTSG